MWLSAWVTYWAICIYFQAFMKIIWDWQHAQCQLSPNFGQTMNVCMNCHAALYRFNFKKQKQQNFQWWYSIKADRHEWLLRCSQKALKHLPKGPSFLVSKALKEEPGWLAFSLGASCLACRKPIPMILSVPKRIASRKQASLGVPRGEESLQRREGGWELRNSHIAGQAGGAGEAVGQSEGTPL